MNNCDIFEDLLRLQLICEVKNNFWCFDWKNCSWLSSART